MTLTLSILTLLAAFMGGFFGARLTQASVVRPRSRNPISLRRRTTAAKEQAVEPNADPEDSLVRDWLVGTPKEGDD